MAETLKIDAVKIIDGIADHSCDLAVVAALREAQTALKRLAAIKAEHHRLVSPSIHGHQLHQLLYGDIDELERV